MAETKSIQEELKICYLLELIQLYSHAVIAVLH